MTQELELVTAHGEHRIDSRLVAKGIGVQHDNLMQTIDKYQSSLEKYGILLFQTGKIKGRGRPEQYVLLNKEQFGYLLMFVRVNDTVRAYREFVYDTFLEYERLQRIPASSVHTFTDTFRPRALENLRCVPDGYFSVMGELFKHLYNLEALFNRSLDEHAMIEISVGLRWARYAREVVGIPDQHRCKYAHVCQGGRTEQVWAYALRYVTTFDKWLWEVYFPQHFPDYERYRAKYVGLAATKIREQLPSPKNYSQAMQPPLEWE